MSERIKVLLPLPIRGPLDYLADEALSPGTWVRVPLSGREVAGIVWDEEEGGKPLPAGKLKEIIETVNLPRLPADHRQFIDWVARYTMSAPGAVLRQTLNVPHALKDPPTRILFTAGKATPDRMTPARKAVLKAVQKYPDGATARELAEAAGVSEAVVRGLDGQGLKSAEAPVDWPFPVPDADRPGPVLTAEQGAAANHLREAIRAKTYSTTLLEGVTGSGKTEVYFEAIAEALKTPGVQCLVLVPEIALTSQWLGRFRDRFGSAPVEWHSDLGSADRRRAWRAVARGEARVVVGARSALFLPFSDLGLIIIDEEHDPSFKQEEGVIYHARDMAVVRANLGGFPLVLASATPAMETVRNVQEGRYGHAELKERHGGALLPEMEAIDLRAHMPAAGMWISGPLEDAIGETLARGEQALLFLNRRGYAPLTLCRTCGERVNCPNCTAWLVEHRFRGELLCHHCGYTRPKPRACPECGAEGTLVPCGPGVERLAEEVARLFPDARLLVMTSDTIRTPRDARAAVEAIESGQADILIGTQIVTKGYHFPKLTLVGVVDADLGLKGADLRAGEHTYQQLAQVAGRAGRAERPGRVLMQTFQPDHPVARALVKGDKDAFVERELKMRKMQKVPPYGRMAALIVTGRLLEDVTAACRRLSSTAPQAKGITVLGPAPAPLARLRGRHRYRYLAISDRGTGMQPVIRDWLRRAGRTKGVKIRIDIDPQSFV